MASGTKRKQSETFNPKELYDLCDRCDENKKAFDSIRRWLNKNKNDNNKLKVAITYQGDFNRTPLQLILLKKSSPPLDIIQTIIKYAPEVLKMKIQSGWLHVNQAPGVLEMIDSANFLPIHVACVFGASFEIVQALVNSYPKSIKVTDEHGWLPLFFACAFEASLDVLNFLIESYPEAIDQKNRPSRFSPMEISPLYHLKRHKYAEKSDDNGMLPLHQACKNGYSLYLIHLLIQACPESSTVPDNDGKTPFQYFNETASHMDERGMTLLHRQAAHSKGLCAGGLPFLFDAYPEAIRLQDKSGLLPIHHACFNKMSSLDTLMLLLKLYPECIAV